MSISDSSDIAIVEFLGSVNAILAEVLRRDSSLEEVLVSVCELARNETRADGAAVEMVEGEELIFRAGAGILAAHAGRRRHRAGSISDIAIVTREMQICEDCENDPRVDREASRSVGVRSRIIVPFGTEQQGAGVLEAVHREVAGFRKRDIEVLRLLAGILTTSIERRRESETHAEIDRALESSRRMASLGQLSATIAHEINNVLMGISPFAELIDRATTDEKIRKAVRNIRKSVDRGKRVTTEVLGFVGARSAEMKRIDLGVFFREIHSEILSLLGSRASVDLEVSDGLTIIGDEKQLAQVIVNLALNAKDAMRAGGLLRIEVARADPEHVARLKLDSSVEYVDICIIDDGEGMDEAVAKRIFEPLFTTKHKGTGLGLSIVQQVVKAHRGDITLETAPGEGTTFHLILPRDGTVTGMSPPLVRDARTVLLIEDDLSVGAGLSAALEHENINVRWRKDCRSGIEALTEQIDAVILDVRLPDCDGRDLFDRLRAIRREITIVFSTGHGDETTLRDYLAKGNVALLKKPYEISELLRILKSPS